MPTTNTYDQIPLEQIAPSPYQARKEFAQEALDSLAQSMKQEGQLQPILVRRIGEPENRGNGGGGNRRDGEAVKQSDVNTAVSPAHPLADSPFLTYELISGERRLRAAKLLGWKTIEAKVISTVSEGEAAAKGLVENLQREDLNPVEEAEGFAELNKLDPRYWKQNRIAEVCGKSQTYISQSMKLLDLPAPIQKNIRAQIFSRSHGIELSRLPSPELQLKVAKKIPGRLTWEETRQVVDTLLNQSHSPANLPAAGQNYPSSLEKDPLAELWPDLQMRDQLSAQGSWEASYGKFKLKGVDVPLDGWTFRVATPGVTPKSELTRWFRHMADAMEKAIDTKKEEADFKKKLEAMGAHNDQDLSELEHEADGLRLPKTPTEQKELEDLIPQGPQATYAWIYGKHSPTAHNMEGKTWSDLGIEDPADMVREMLDQLRLIQKAELGV